MNDSILRTSPAQRLANDLQEVREVSHAIGDRLSAVPDDKRVLVVLSAGGKADQFYRPALHRLVNQMSDLQRRANIVLVLNDGTPYPEGFALPETEVVHLQCAKKQGPGMAAPVYLPEKTADTPYILSDSQTQPHTLHVLHQPQSPYAAGKINGLRDAYGMLLQSTVRREALPHTTMFIDAESHFYRAPQSHLRAPESESNGLQPLFQGLQGANAPRVVGSKVRLCAFRLLSDGQQRIPDFDAPISDLHTANNWAHGRLRHRYFSGGGIAGYTPELLALGQTVSKYVGMRSEDAAEVALAERAGIPWSVVLQSIHTNFCPPRSERGKVLEQLARWAHGHAALKELYGVLRAEQTSVVERVVGRANDFLYLLQNPAHAMRVLQDKRDVHRAMKQYPPEHPLDGVAKWTTA